MSILQKIADIEAEMARTQKNKATSGHLGLLKGMCLKFILSRSIELVLWNSYIWSLVS